MGAATASAKIGTRTFASLVAEFLARRGVRRVYGLCGGHIQPIWDEVARSGIQIVDVRHESAAVYMAQAQADLTGSLGVAMVTAGPGLTNAATGIANASVSTFPRARYLGAAAASAGRDGRAAGYTSRRPGPADLPEGRGRL